MLKDFKKTTNHTTLSIDLNFYKDGTFHAFFTVDAGFYLIANYLKNSGKISREIRKRATSYSKRRT